MLAMDDLLKDVPLPRMVKAVQNFERPVLEDVGGELTRKLREGNEEIGRASCRERV